MNSVLIYTTFTCPWCTKAKEFLKKKKVKFKEVNVVGNLKAQKEIVQKSGQMGVPVLDIGGTIVVGFDPQGIANALKEFSPAKKKNAAKMKKKRP